MSFLERNFFGSQPVRWLLAAFLLATLRAPAADIDKTRALFVAGHYQEALRIADQVVNKEQSFNHDWAILLARAQMALGRYPAALTTVSNALRGYRTVPLELEAWSVFNANGLTDQAQQVLNELGSLARTRLRAESTPSELVALGKALIVLNAEPKLVLENFFDEARRRDPENREARLAAGELALDKHDYALAAKIFDEALKKLPDDPDVLFGLARAYAPSDRALFAEALDGALDANTNHVPAMLLVVDKLIDAEDYTEAGKMIARALEVNPWSPEAWAYRAVLGHLRGETNSETSARASGLKFWRTNPGVDHLIGLKLSQKYRFLEGAAYQRSALKFDPDYLPAKIQLAQDLLRLGRESEGWSLANDVHEKDGYDVTAFNLSALHESIAKFQTITNSDFILRMSPREAAIYGDRALALLQAARDHLSKKYGFTPSQPTVVEVFPEQKDFGVRTFGIPDNPGFLGVCFGNVVTANSPASQAGHPANWQAVLWHEFCHVITLGLTRNKMPRWLSEGISVYEERQANPTWGQTMNPHYREMVLGEDLTPVSKLSSAFLNPKSPASIQFAYYESSLVVEYLVGAYGFEALKSILGDLGGGAEINDAIARRAAPMEKFEKGFVEFAHARAKNLAPGLDWKDEKPAHILFNLETGDEPPDSPAPPTNRVRRTRSQPNRAASTNSADELFRRRYAVRRPDTNAPILQVDPNGDSHIAPPPGARTQETNALPSLMTRGTNQATVTSDPTPVSPAATEAPAQSLPNYWRLMQEARADLKRKEWAEAKIPLAKLIELYPAQTGEESAYAMLAEAHRELGETNAEREALEKLASMEDDDVEAYARLIELDEARHDWAGTATNAERYLAVNPLVPQPYRGLARASEELEHPAPAARSYERLLLLDPPDPAETHFRLARQLRLMGDPAASKRQTLEALEEAPRFRDAQRLLLELEKPAPAVIPPAPSPGIKP